MFPESQYPVTDLKLQPGNLLVLYSDGLTEAGIERGKDFGESRLESLVVEHHDRPLAEIQQHVLSAVHRWAGVELEDDLTLLLVRATASQKEAL